MTLLSYVRYNLIHLPFWGVVYYLRDASFIEESPEIICVTALVHYCCNVGGDMKTKLVLRCNPYSQLVLLVGSNDDYD